MNDSSDPLVRDYLRTVEQGLAPLPPHRREEILGDLRAHLDDVLAGATTPREVRDALFRFGSPHDIAAAARAEENVTVASTGREWLAVMLVTLGGLCTAGLAWFVGIALIWRSPVWSREDKLVATFVPPLGISGSWFLLAFVVGTTDNVAVRVAQVVVLVLALVAPFVSIRRIVRRLRAFDAVLAQ